MPKAKRRTAANEISTKRGRKAVKPARTKSQKRTTKKRLTPAESAEHHKLATDTHIHPETEEYLGTKSLEAFLPSLASLAFVREALELEFKQAPNILAKLKAGQSLSTEELAAAHDCISDLVRNESDVVDSLTGKGSFDDFSINIMQFESVFWIDAAEFDEIGYFATFEEASTRYLK